MLYDLIDFRETDLYSRLCLPSSQALMVIQLIACEDVLPTEMEASSKVIHNLQHWYLFTSSMPPIRTGFEILINIVVS